MAPTASGGSPRRWVMPVLAGIVLVLAATVFLIRHTPIGPRIVPVITGLFQEAEPACCAPDMVLAAHNMPLIAYAVNDIWHEGKAREFNLPERMRKPAQAVHVAAVANGEIVRDAWLRQGTVLDALTTGINQLKRDMSAAERNTIDAIELFFGHSLRDVRAEDVAVEVLGDRHRGIRGFEVTYDDRTLLVSPLHAVRENADAKSDLAGFAQDKDIDPEIVIEAADYRILDGEQIVVRLGDSPSAALMERGNDFVPVTAINADGVRHAAGLATQWLASHVARDGALAYGYLPSELDVLGGNNLIRQWMATIALQRAADLQYDFGFWELARRNLEHNVDTFFHQEDELGVVYRRQNRVTLGGLALAALAIHESDSQTALAGHEEALNRSIESMRLDTGAFKTFVRPSDRETGQNFYPGEALLYWATRYARDQDPALLERIMGSFRYYRDWHRENRNPAFIGWHTQAYFSLWQQTRDDDLQDFIFEMNDWLLGVQQWGVSNQYRDIMGRFYVPGARFGRPHASSTGIYLEGLVDAFSLARTVGDEERAEAYRIAILRGLRSVLQLQFQDDTDMFYVPEGFRKYVRGGIRTTVYDNTIRIDNVQHNLMAMMKVLRVFRPEDYVYPDTDN